MTISSRTPEGVPFRCPTCANEVSVELSFPIGDAPCPHCGALLIYVALQDMVLIGSHLPGSDRREAILQMMADHLKVPKDVLAEHPVFQRKWDGDSLDLVEAVMELEDEFGANPAS